MVRIRRGHFYSTALAPHTFSRVCAIHRISPIADVWTLCSTWRYVALLCSTTQQKSVLLCGTAVEAPSRPATKAWFILRNVHWNQHSYRTRTIHVYVDNYPETNNVLNTKIGHVDSIFNYNCKYAQYYVQPLIQIPIEMTASNCSRATKRCIQFRRHFDLFFRIYRMCIVIYDYHESELRRARVWSVSDYTKAPHGTPSDLSAFYHNRANNANS